MVSYNLPLVTRRTMRLSDQRLQHSKKRSLTSNSPPSSRAGMSSLVNCHEPCPVALTLSVYSHHPFP